MKYLITSILTVFLVGTLVQTIQAKSISLEFYLEWEQSQADEGKALTLRFRDSEKTILVEPTPFLTEDDIDRAELIFMKDRAGEIGVRVLFKSEAAALLEKITSENISRKLVVSLNEQVISAPVIMSKVSGGAAVVRANYSLREAKVVADKLNKGGMPTRVDYQSAYEIILNAKQLGYYILINQPMARLSPDEAKGVEEMLKKVSLNAITVVDECLAINPSDERNANLLLVQAVLYQYLNQRELAKKSLEKIISDFPNSKVAGQAWEIMRKEFKQQ